MAGWLALRRLVALSVVALCTLVPVAQAQQNTSQLIASFYGPMPTGVTVSRTGRIFPNFPR